MKKAKLTKQKQLNNQYSRQIYRIKKLVEKMTEQGFVVPELGISKPKKVTEATIRKLKSYTKEAIAEKSIYRTEQGEEITGARGLYYERKKASMKATATRKAKKMFFSNEIQQAIEQYRQEHPSFVQPTLENTGIAQSMLEYVEEYIDNLPYAIYHGTEKAVIVNYKDELKRIVQSNKSQLGTQEYEKYLNENESEIVDYATITEGYQKDSVQGAISNLTRLALLLNIGELTMGASIYSSDFEEELEGYEDL